MFTAQMVADQQGKSLAEVEKSIELAKRSLVADPRPHIVVRENNFDQYLTVTRNGVGPLKTAFGRFHHFDFAVSDTWKKYSLIYCGELNETFEPVLAPGSPLRLRIDSGCETGQMFGDYTCECRQQLEEALKRISKNGGMVINVPAQDGRGFRLAFKLATLRLQDELDVDTVQAGDLLIPDGSKDIRTYAGVIAILKFLGVNADRTIRLMSNNPKKQAVFVENGYRIEEEDLIIEPTEYNRKHLEAKQKLLGHKNLIKD